jgi:hypothetical protein
VVYYHFALHPVLLLPLSLVMVVVLLLALLVGIELIGGKM